MRIKNFDLSNTQAFIFDLDGTLVHSEHVWAKAKMMVANEHGAQLVETQLEEFVGRSLNAFVDFFFASSSMGHKQQLLNEIRSLALNTLEREMFLVEGASALIKEVSDHGFKIAICSSASMRAIELAIDKLEIGEYIDLVISGDDVVNSKPDPEPYYLTLQNLKIQANQAVVVEDSYAGYNSANAAQIPTIIVEQSDAHKFHEAVALFGHLSEIKFLG